MWGCRDLENCAYAVVDELGQGKVILLLGARFSESESSKDERRKLGTNILLYHFEILFWKGGEGYDDDVFEKGGKRWGEGRGLRGKVEVTVEEDIEDECVLEG